MSRGNAVEAGAAAGPPEGAGGVCSPHATSESIQIDGTIQVVLVARPDQPGARALAAWEIDPEQARARWRRILLPGYALQLDRRLPARGGEYMLIVRWTSADGKARITRNTVFEDHPDYVATQPTPN